MKSNLSLKLFNRSGSTPRTQTACCGLALLAVTIVTLGNLNLAAQETATPLPDTTHAATATNTNAEEPTAMPVSTAGEPAAHTNNTDVAKASDASTTGLNLNFRNAPIDLVLEHLSKAAGFIIQMDSSVHGTVSVIGQNLTKEEAINLLNSELNKNGYAAIRSGTRTLRIMDKSTAKSANNPVRISNDPESIPDNDEMVTQIIPIRFVEAANLVTDLSPFVSSGATIVANQAGNSIVITDTQANIRHLVEIIKAIDSSAEDVTEVKVFKLQYADPTEMANLLTGLFPDQSGAATSPIRFGNRGGRGGGGGFGGGFGGRGGGFGGGPGGGGGFNPFAAAFQAGANAGGNSQTDRIKKRNQVVAVADARTSSVVVTATRDLMDQISEMVDQLDLPGKSQRMVVIPINHEDPNSVLQVLQDTVGANTSRSSRNSQTSPFENRVQQNQNNMYNNNSSFGNSGSGFGSRGTGGGFGGNLGR